MNTLDSFNTTGERLSHILDEIGFKNGRGRIPEFQKYLASKEGAGFSDLKYSTVRSWFGMQSPPMKKVSTVIDLLVSDFKFSHPVDSEQIKIWWKLGGAYPFIWNVSLMENEQCEGSDKLHFLITSMVTEATGESFKEIPSIKLNEVKNKAIQLAQDFANPNLNRCPPEYLKGYIVSQLLSS